MAQPVATVNQIDGSATVTYTFRLPPARGRVQPALALTYSSEGPISSVAGEGWSLPLTSIDRDTRATPAARIPGSPDAFFLSEPTQSQPLVPLQEGQAPHYRPASSARYFDAEPHRDASGAIQRWVAHDGVGTRYEFDLGYTEDGGACSAQAPCTRWYLTSAEDADGNVALYRYQRDASAPEARLVAIAYNVIPCPGRVRGAALGEDDFATVVRLDYEPQVAHPIAVGGGLAERTMRLANVVVQARAVPADNPGTGCISAAGAPLAEVAGYHLAYTAGDGVLLSSIRTSGVGGALWPTATQFSYASTPDRAHSLGLHLAGSVGTTFDGAYLDIDGDGRPDRLRVADKALVWQRNTSVPGTLAFDPPRTLLADRERLAPSFSNPDGAAETAYPACTPHPRGPPSCPRARKALITARLQDVNGDGRPDLVSAGDGWSLCARFASETNSIPAYSDARCADLSAVADTWRRIVGAQAPMALSATSEQGAGIADLTDVTGDGLPDFVVVDGGRWQVFRGAYDNQAGAGGIWSFAPQPEILVLDPSSAPISDAGAHARALADMNGDGLPDYVRTDQTSAGAWAWSVSYNLGGRFAPPRAWDASPTLGPLSASDLYDDKYDTPLPLPTAELLDVNNDGLADYVFQACNVGPLQSSCAVHVFYNSGNGYSGAGGEFILPPTAGGVFAGLSGPEGTFQDLNGDGFVDYVTPTTATLGEGAVPVARSDLLVGVTTAQGAQTSFHYTPLRGVVPDAPSGARGVVVETVLSGPYLPTARESYGYAGWLSGRRWYDPGSIAARGFAESCVRDPSGVVTRTEWSQQEAFAGLPVAMARYVGGASCAASGMKIAQTTTTWLARSLSDSGGMCSNAPAHYPLVQVAAVKRSIQFEEGHAFSTETRVDCVSVDSAGNVTSSRNEGDVGDPSDDRYEVVKYDAGAACRSCPTQSTTYADPAHRKPLAQQVYRYADPDEPSRTLPRGRPGEGRLLYVQRVVRFSRRRPVYATDTRSGYNADGTVAWQEHFSPYTKEIFTYDPWDLRVVRDAVRGRHEELRTDTAYDPSAGWPLDVRGPYVVDSASLVPERLYAYDPFGRVVSTALGGDAPRVLTRTTYDDASLPASVTEQQFNPATPSSEVKPEPDWPLAAADEANRDRLVSVSYFDPLGRPLQTRAALNSGPAILQTPLAQSVGGTALTSFSRALDPATVRVQEDRRYDAAGRLAARFIPYFDSGLGYSSEPDLHRTGVISYRYDGWGRRTCVTFSHREPSSDGGAGGPCRTVDSSGGTYARATQTTYGVVEFEGRFYRSISTKSADQSAGMGAGVQLQAIDGAGRVRYAVDPYGAWRVYVYDRLGRLASVHRGAGTVKRARATSVTAMTYDLLGRVVQRRDSNEGGETRRYLPSGQLLSISFNSGAKRPLGATGLRYAYDDLGRLDSVVARETDPRGKLTTRLQRSFGYDAPNGGPSFAGGHVTSEWSGGVLTRFRYGMDGGVAAVDYTLPDGARYRVTETRSLSGRLLSVAADGPGLDSFAEYRLESDSAGQVTQVTSAGQSLWSAGDAGAGGFDAAGRLLSASIDGGRAITTLAVSPETDLPSSEAVTVDGAPAEGRRDIRYQGLLASVWTDAVTGAEEQATYDADSRLIALTDRTAAASRASGVAWSVRFSPRSDGALTRVAREDLKTGALQAETYHYAKAHPDQLRSVVRAPRTSSSASVYGYDARGRIVQRGSERLAYDVENRLTRVQEPNGSATALAYDASGGLIALTRISAQRRLTTKTYYLGPFLTVTYGPNGRLPAFHILVDGSRIATRRSDGSLLYYVRDVRGSVVGTFLHGSGGVHRVSYGPYGEATEAGPSATDIGFAGGVRVSPTLILMGARVYDVRARRFLQPDRLDALPYSYAGDDPVNYVDPSGHTRRELIQETIGYRLELYSETSGTEAFAAAAAASETLWYVVGAAGFELNENISPLDVGLGYHDLSQEALEQEAADAIARAAQEGIDQSVSQTVDARPETSSLAEAAGEDALRDLNGNVIALASNSASDAGTATDLGVSVGLQGEGSFVLSPLSSGGGTVGLNLELSLDTSGITIGLYSYRPSAPSMGYNVGFAIGGNAAFGSGPWTGDFENYGGGLKTIGGSAFQSKDYATSGGWRGLSLSTGWPPVPALYATQTNYASVWGFRLAFPTAQDWNALWSCIRSGPFCR